MTRLFRTALLRTAAAALAATAASACSSDAFLKCADCVTSPNAPTTATNTQRIVASQAKLWQFLNGNMARITSMWTQQMAGTQLQYQTWDQYLLDADMAATDFAMPYSGGGLVDLKKIEGDALAANDRTFAGIAQVLKAWEMGTAADFWGDVPYTQAARPDSFPAPAYDPQKTVYDSVLAALDAAVANLQAGTGTGPGAAELVYKGDRTKWTALAHTLKARFYLHLAERDASNYAKALAEANLGIVSNTGDYVTAQSSNTNQQNDWYQFQLTGTRTGFTRGGKYLIDLLKSAGDPRLAEYFQKGTGTQATDYLGATPGQALQSWMANVSAKRLAPDYGQPLVTYNENLLIKAEALVQLGNAAAARDTVNRERAAWATATSWHSALTLAPLGGTVALADVMREKYIVLFQNVEAFNDYKRTCLPAIAPANGAIAVPGRFLYTNGERQTNPKVPADPARNWNDPQPCS